MTMIKNTLSGYDLIDIFTDTELEIIIEMINNNFRKIIKLYVNNENEYHVTNYHEFHQIFNHNKIWNKKNRFFSKDQINNILEMNYFRNLYSKGKYIVDLENNGYPEIYWRLVRPNHSEDVAPNHNDSMFWTATHNIAEEIQNKWDKVWVNLNSNSSTCPLQIIPLNYNINLDYTEEIRHERKKPQPNKIIDDIYFKNEIRKPGQGFIFSNKLIHKGIIHQEPYTRISLEFIIHNE